MDVLLANEHIVPEFLRPRVSAASWGTRITSHPWLNSNWQRKALRTFLRGTKLNRPVLLRWHRVSLEFLRARTSA